MESLETELERARGLDTDDLADAIQTIGFECTRCGACCTGADTNADTDAGANADTATDGNADTDVDWNTDTDTNWNTDTDTDGNTDTGTDGNTDTDTDGNTDTGTDGNTDTDGTPDDRAAPDTEAHTATVFPDEIRRLQETTGYDWRDVARPMPYGLVDGPDGPAGETFEWALETDACGDCTFYAESDGVGACTVHSDRPLICETYPFSVALGGTSQPMGDPVDEEGILRAHECEGLGRDIPRADAVELAAAIKRRAVRELEEAIEVRDTYESLPEERGVVVHDSEGAKRPDGSPIE